MSYAYANKEEEEYYTKWKKDLEDKGRNEAINKMAAYGLKIDQIADIMKIPVKEVSDILTANS